MQAQYEDVRCKCVCPVYSVTTDDNVTVTSQHIYVNTTNNPEEWYVARIIFRQHNAVSVTDCT